jgi:demethylmenaquinone methyltransferase/2-methoxy-6-polyprenyl-1,4-benzoquinol methylase
MSDVPQQIISEMQTYYRDRAGEYDEWWFRKGRYDRGPESNAEWFAEMAEVQGAFDAAGFSGEVLELAPGTGNWTERLARSAAHVTALDASPEMIALNTARLTAQGLADKVAFHQTDLFAWQPQLAYDGFFFGFWLSHVPAERLDDFLEQVAAALRPGGMLGIIDSRREQSSTAPDQPLAPAGEDIMTRRLNDGRAYQIVKRYFAPEELAALLARHDIDADVRETALHFIYVVGRKRGTRE